MKKKKPSPWSFGKKLENSIALGALEKTMKEKTTTLGALEKSKKKKIMALKI
jgi:hypothetical protein